MRRFVIETSLFEPIEVEIGGRVYATVALSKQLIDAINDIQAQVREKKLADLDGSVRVAALIFGVPVEEFETLDLRALNPAVEYALQALNEGRVKQPPAVGAESGQPVEPSPKN